MKNSLKTLAISAGVISILSLVLAGTVFVMINNDLENIGKIEQEIANEESQIKNVENVISVLEKTKLSRDELATYILPDANIVSIVETIEKLAEKNSLNAAISGLEAEDSSEAKKGTINTVKMHVDVKGSWTDLMTFMTVLENIPYKSTIDSVVLRKSTLEDKTKSEWSLGFNIKLLKIK